MKIIDPHLHLFDLKQGDYHWLKEDNPPFWPDKYLINKAFKETDLTLKPSFTLNHFIHIEAGFDNQQPWRELITLQQNCKTPFRAIAAINLTLSSQKFNECLEKLIELDSFIGVRHLLDEQALSLLTSEQVLTNLTKLNDTAKQKSRPLIFETQLPLAENTFIDALCYLINTNPNITFIINHAGFPPTNIHSDEWQHWQSNLLRLAAYSHVAIKCSGWEMTKRQYTQDWLAYNLTTIFEAFGLNRMMMASNFPLCLFSHDSYQSYWHSITENHFFQTLSEQEKSALFYNNALRWYAINC
jgi:predicted TIM-barrel fold metal-dependent hydrolase